MTTTVKVVTSIAPAAILMERNYSSEYEKSSHFLHSRDETFIGPESEQHFSISTGVTVTVRELELNATGLYRICDPLAENEARNSPDHDVEEDGEQTIHPDLND